MRPFPPWSTITREERYFTALLFHDLTTNPAPFWSLLRSSSRVPIEPSEVVDVAFEACFFRDASLQKLISRRKELEKQTFDFMLFLSNREIVIVEAKAQQAYTWDQIDNLKKSREIITNEGLFKAVHLAALFSSKYSPRETTLREFDMSTSWAKVAQIPEYTRNAKHHQRADDIYSL